MDIYKDVRISNHLAFQRQTLPSKSSLNFLVFTVHPNHPHEISSFFFLLALIFQVSRLLSLLQFSHSSWSRLSVLCRQGQSFTGVNNPSFLKNEYPASKNCVTPCSKPPYIKTRMNKTSICPKRIWQWPLLQHSVKNTPIPHVRSWSGSRPELRI